MVSTTAIPPHAKPPAYGLHDDHQRWLLNERNVDAILDSSVSTVVVSLHSLDPERYAYLSGLHHNDAVERVKGNVEQLVHKRGTRKFPKIIINSLAMRSSADGILNIAEWVCSAGLDGLRVIRLMPSDDDFFEREYIPRTPENTAFLSQVERTLARDKRFYDHPFPNKVRKLTSVLGGLRNVQQRHEYLYYALRKMCSSVLRRQCGIGGLSLFVDHLGVVSACPNGRRSLGRYSELQSAGFNSLVRRSLHDRGPSTCAGCTFHTGMARQAHADAS